ncbi:MAG: hypothetical protein AB6733_18665 [Clostridiaceae bacterium]
MFFFYNDNKDTQKFNNNEAIFSDIRKKEDISVNASVKNTYSFFKISKESEKIVESSFKERQQEILLKEKPILTRLLEKTEYEMGYESVAERYFNALHEKYGIVADTILQNIYLDNMYDHNYLIKHLLYIIAELPRGRRDNLVLIAIAGLSNPDIEVQDLSVRCFECWGDKKHVKSLEKLESETRVEWLKEYINQVIQILNQEV